MSENNNGQPPNPEEMGARLDEEIKGTVEDWAAENPDQTETAELNERIDIRLRRMMAGWVGADENANWKEIGSRMDAHTRGAIGRWVGAEEGADWPTISGRIEARTRSSVARLVRAQGKAGEEGAEQQASWSDIGTKIEQDVRGWIGGLVGTQPDADWQTIGNQLVHEVRGLFDRLTGGKTSQASEEAERGRTVKIDIEGEENAEGDNPPVVKSSKPVDPES